MLPAELAPQVLLGLWEKFAATSPFLLRTFFPPQPHIPEGIHIQYDIYSYNRGMAALTPRFAPAPRGVMPVRQRVAFDAITVKEELEPELAAMLDGTAPGSLDQSNRERAVATALRQIRNRLDNRLEWIAAQWLTGGALLSSTGVPTTTPTGTVYLDYDPIANNAPVSVNIGLQSSHVASHVTSSWETSTTDIFADLEAARETILEDSGVDARCCLMNSNTFRRTLLVNDMVRESEYVKAQIARDGYLSNLWSWEFLTYDGVWYPSAATMAADSVTPQKLIPDDVVIILSRDNVASGRALIECSPSDAQAPPGHRGVYAWEDRQPAHPHNVVYGIEWSGCPVMMDPDTIFIYADVTSVS